VKHDGGGGTGGQKAVKLTSEGTPQRKGRCRNCGIYGHLAEDCKRPKKEKKNEEKEATNVVVADAQPALFMVSASEIVHKATKFVHLAEKKVAPIHCDDGVWVLDTGASNHMTGTREALTRLDEEVSGNVRFGDGSCVEIKGLGSIVMEGRDCQHKVLTNVYYIPKLQSNIISLGQLEEAGCEVLMKNGRLTVVDSEGKLVINVPRTSNRLYTLKNAVVRPICLHMNLVDPTWVWHARFGHLNFRAL
jgi:hypothetical protein